MIMTESVTINVSIGMSKYLSFMNAETELIRNALLLYQIQYTDKFATCV